MLAARIAAALFRAAAVSWLNRFVCLSVERCEHTPDLQKDLISVTALTSRTLVIVIMLQNA